jgi:murein L,D-transpeptidase YcbB/YkuD
VDAVKAFQSGNGLKPDGIVGPSTLFVMNGRSRDEQIASIVANLERWRWMPRDLGPFYVMVNVPEYTLRVVDDGNVVHETRVVVGKPTNPTPFFSSEISYLIVNPYWHVPTSIISKEMLPEIRSDPYGYFARQGYEVFLRYNGKFRQVDPRWVNWYVVNPRDLQIRQVPGDDNALGRIKFMFPNQYSVYLHDTPSKSFFLRDKRDLSHGCVRVQNPLDFADSLLKVASPDWNSKRLEKLFGGAERRVNLKTHVPVHLAYFTEWVDPDGTLQHFDDIYGYDSELSRVLG